jgi:hypothetical protein
MDTPSRNDREVVFAQILYLFVTPTLLIYYKIIPGSYRLIMLGGVALLLYGIIRRAQWTRADMGIVPIQKQAVLPYVLFTTGGVCFILWLAYISPLDAVRPGYEWWEDARFLILFIPISVLQEVIFRGILNASTCILKSICRDHFKCCVVFSDACDLSSFRFCIANDIYRRYRICVDV